MLQNWIPSFPWIAPPRPPPWHNPRKGRDQILPSGNTAVRAPMATWCICFLRLTPLREIHYATAASFKVSNFLARVRFFKLSHVRLAFRSSFLELEKVNWVIKSKDSRTQRDSPGNPFPSLKPFQASNRSFCLGLIWLSKLWKNSSLFWAWRSFPTRKFVFLVHFNRIDQTFSTKANISKPNH